jgi:predicted RNA methylase
MDASSFVGEVKYYPQTNNLALVRGQGWAFNGTKAWRDVRYRWQNENANWVGSNQCHNNPLVLARLQRFRKLEGEQMADVFENTINDLMASYCREHGLKITTQPGVRLPHRRAIPDFELRNGGVLYGEGEWNSSYVKGYDQAIEFGDIPGTSGYFLIGYPDELKERVKQRRIKTASPSVLLKGVTYRGMFKLKGERPSLFRAELEELPSWLEESLARQPRPPNATEFVELMRDIVQGLTDLLPVEGRFPSLFEHIIASMPKEGPKIDTARKAAAYLLLNQIVFYRILEERGYPTLRPAALKHPGDLKREYFDMVLRDDYQAIFNFDIASLFPQDAIQYIRDMVEIVTELQPEQFTRDLLGNIFHSLIPLEVRKPVAAYYTNPMAARLLAKLAIESAKDSVADFACGSGTLLMAAYDRKAQLLGHPMDQESHKRFVEEELTGVDIMPFAAHLAVVQLALRNPGYLTNRVRVAVYDSTFLRPGANISSLQRVMPRGQSFIHDFHEENLEKRKVREGAVSSEGAGRGFDVRPVDVVIMNPPFTRKQLVTKDFRKILTSRFEDYSEYSSKEQNLFAYFILLADRFLSTNGRLAMVLPQTILRQLSSHGVRKLLTTRYNLEYIIQSGYRLAFSESTAFREILLVARKTVVGSKEPLCVLARLEAMPNETNVDKIASVLQHAFEPDVMKPDSGGLVNVSTISQRSLQGSANWQALLPEEEIEGFTLPQSPLLTPLSEVVPFVIQGIRFDDSSDRVNVKNTILSRPRRDVNVKLEWKIIGESDKEVTATSTDSGETVHVPKEVLQPTTRSPAGMATMEIDSAPDFIVTARFPNDTRFWVDPNPNAILRKRVPHLRSREGQLLLAGRNNVNLSAPGTHFLAFVSPGPVPPTWSFWSLRPESLEEARLLALWWNSTFNIIQLIGMRAEVGGSWMGWLKKDLLQIRVLTPKTLTDTQKTKLLEVYNRWKGQDFPSLVDQFSTRYPGRLAIDSTLAPLIGIDSSDAYLGALYETVAKRLGWMKGLMTRE